MRDVYDRTDGQDGRVSIEVDPRLAHRTDATIAEARALWWMVDRANVMIKIPATQEGLAAITAATAEGISVNVTLIFSLDRYRDVMDAYLTGLEQAKNAGIDLSSIRSVASFFVSRVDTEVDKRLDAMSADRRATRPPGCAARPRSRTPASPTRRTKRCSPPTGGRHSTRTARTSSARCGHPRRSRTPTFPTRCTSPTWSRPTPSTRCRKAPSRQPRTTARSPATR